MGVRCHCHRDLRAEGLISSTSDIRGSGTSAEDPPSCATSHPTCKHPRQTATRTTHTNTHQHFKMFPVSACLNTPLLTYCVILTLLWRSLSSVFTSRLLYKCEKRTMVCGECYFTPMCAERVWWRWQTSLILTLRSTGRGQINSLRLKNDVWCEQSSIKGNRALLWSLIWWETPSM